MKAIVLRKTGGPEILVPSDVPDPVPGKGEVLVRNHYIGINYAEILSRKGLYGWAVKRPYILGMECSGIIEDTGKGVDKSRIGQKVMLGAKSGAYAEKIVVPLANTIPAIDSYSMEENASFLVNYMTAWVALVKMAGIRPGDKVLITAAAGGVGTAAVQIAAKMGCEVIGMAGSEEKVQFIKNLGAAFGLNYRSDSCFKDLITQTGGVDVVLEVVGGEVFKRSLKCLNPFGRMVVTGFASLDLNKWNPLSWVRAWRDMPKVNVGDLAKRSIAVMSSHIGYLLENEPGQMSVIYEELARFVTENNINPVVGRVFPFDEAPLAHEYIESRKSRGKVLLKLNI